MTTTTVTAATPVSHPIWVHPTVGRNLGLLQAELAVQANTQAAAAATATANANAAASTNALTTILSSLGLGVTPQPPAPVSMTAAEITALVTALSVLKAPAAAKTS